MRVDLKSTATVIVDVQDRLFPHMAEAICEDNIVTLIKGIRALRSPLLATEQYKKGLGDTLPSIAEALDDVVPVEKIAFSCMDEPAFVEQLKAAVAGNPPKFVILAGIETHVCVLQTAVDLLAEGYVPVIPADAVSSRSMADKSIALDRIRHEGGIVTTVESILFELCRVSRTEAFKAVSSLVK